MMKNTILLIQAGYFFPWLSLKKLLIVLVESGSLKTRSSAMLFKTVLTVSAFNRVSEVI